MHIHIALHLNCQAQRPNFVVPFKQLQEALLLLARIHQHQVLQMPVCQTELSLRSLLQQDVHHRSQAVGSAGSIGHHVVIGLVVFSVVHSVELLICLFRGPISVFHLPFSGWETRSVFHN